MPFRLMRRSVRLAAATAAFLVASGMQIDAADGPGFATAWAQADAVRPEVGKPLQQASELLKANRAKDALAKVREAEAVPNRSATEQLTIDRMRGAAAARAGETQTAIKSFEASLASGRLGQAEQAQTTAQLAYLYSQLKDWNKTRDLAQKAKQIGASATEMDKLLAYVNSQTGDFGAIARDAQASIEAAEKAGRRPEENDLLALADAQRRTGNAAGQMATLEKLVAHYPKKDYWVAVLSRIPAKPGFSGRLALDVDRLKWATKSLNSAEEIIEMAQLALQDSQAAEAKAVLEEGFARGLLGKGAEGDRQKRLLALATQRAADAPTALAAAEAEAKDGNALVRIGLAYSGLGQHDKGIALIQKGIAQGDLRNPDHARLHLGIAFHRAGNKAKAAEAFRSVRGTDGAADLARLWMRV
jgi:tetratricopeptide (TPR) repeat protein